MADTRVQKLAKILVEYSIDVKKGETIEISFGIGAKEMALEVFKLVMKKGAYPLLNPFLPRFSYNFYKLANEDQLTRFPKIRLYEIKNIDGSININTQLNTRELTNVDPKKMILRSKALHPIQDEFMKKRWVICEYPTNALAQDAEMSLDEFEDFSYKATNIDWKKESKRQDKLKRILDKGEIVRIVGENTDLSFSIKGRKGIKCDGHYNMPDGEVYIAPVDDSANGKIAYTYPAIRMGKEVSGIQLEFKNGKVVKFSATKNKELLKESLNIDKGAKRLGEFGIGLNYNIKHFIKQILFDEKIGGTIHLALGMAYKKGGGRNKSAIHWDMIKDLRKGGELYIDGKLIQKNGKFTFKL